MKKKILIPILIVSILCVIISTVLICCLLGGDKSTGGIHVQDPDASVPKGNAVFMMQVGDTKKWVPTDAEGSLVFQSADSKVASVDADGTVTAVSVGETEITCEIDGDSFVCSVFISRKGAPKEKLVPPDVEGFAAVMSSSGGYVGEYAIVTLYLMNAPDLSGFSLSMTYNSEALELKKALFVNEDIDYGDVRDDEAGTISLAALSYETNGMQADGNAPVIARFVFYIKDSASGEQAIELLLNDGDMFVLVENGEEQTVLPELYGGKITIAE